MRDHDDSGGEPIDRIFQVLKHPLRRDVVELLAEHPPSPVHIDPLVDRIMEECEAAHELEHEDVMAGMHHHHLPMLEDHEVIEFDPVSGFLRYTPDDGIEEWLEIISQWEEGCLDL